MGFFHKQICAVRLIVLLISAHQSGQTAALQIHTGATTKWQISNHLLQLPQKEATKVERSAGPSVPFTNHEKQISGALGAIVPLAPHDENEKRTSPNLFTHSLLRLTQELVRGIREIPCWVSLLWSHLHLLLSGKVSHLELRSRKQPLWNHILLNRYKNRENSIATKGRSAFKFFNYVTHKLNLSTCPVISQCEGLDLFLPLPLW